MAGEHSENSEPSEANDRGELKDAELEGVSGGILMDGTYSVKKPKPPTEGDQFAGDYGTPIGH